MILILLIMVLGLILGPGLIVIARGSARFRMVVPNIMDMTFVGTILAVWVTAIIGIITIILMSLAG